MRDATDTVIANNVVYGLGAGIFVDHVPGGTGVIARNVINGNVVNRTGPTITPGEAQALIRLGSDGTTIEDNIITGNVVSGAPEPQWGAISLVTDGVSFGARNKATGNTLNVTHAIGAAETAGIWASFQRSLVLANNTINGVLASDAGGSPTIRAIWLTSCPDSIVEANSSSWKTSYGIATPDLRGIQSDAASAGSAFRFNKFDWSGTGGTKDRIGYIDPSGSTQEGNQTIAGAALSGTATLVAGSVTIGTAEVLAGDRIRVTRQALGGTPGHLSIGAIVAGTSFTIGSSSEADTSEVAWEIVH